MVGESSDDDQSAPREEFFCRFCLDAKLDLLQTPNPLATAHASLSDYTEALRVKQS